MNKCGHWEIEPINGRDYYYYYPGGLEAGFLCDDCAIEAGFCPSCGAFAAGADDDHLAREGLCLNCEEEWESEMDDDNEYYWGA